MESDRQLSQVAVWTLSEELEAWKEVVKANTSVRDWKRLFAELPVGVNMVIIEGARDYNMASSIAIDDVIIQSCAKFGEPCLVSIDVQYIT